MQSAVIHRLSVSQPFIERLLCPRHCSRVWGSAGKKKRGSLPLKPSAFLRSGGQRTNPMGKQRGSFQGREQDGRLWVCCRGSGGYLQKMPRKQVSSTWAAPEQGPSGGCTSAHDSAAQSVTLAAKPPGLSPGSTADLNPPCLGLHVFGTKMVALTASMGSCGGRGSRR